MTYVSPRLCMRSYGGLTLANVRSLHPYSNNAYTLWYFKQLGPSRFVSVSGLSLPRRLRPSLRPSPIPLSLPHCPINQLFQSFHLFLVWFHNSRRTIKGFFGEFFGKISILRRIFQRIFDFSGTSRRIFFFRCLQDRLMRS